jgi:signal transduction histidine kinase
MRLASALREESEDELHDTGQEAVEQIDDEIVKLRRLITELRPASLDTIGLEAALYALAQQHQQTGEIRIECDFELPREAEERPAPLLETAVYRLAQEALNNVSKHSLAQRAALRVHESDSHIEIEVSDEGVGFDPNLVREGFGLVGMRERAALLGGTLKIESERGSGTMVRAEIPLSPQSDDQT